MSFRRFKAKKKKTTEAKDEATLLKEKEREKKRKEKDAARRHSVAKWGRESPYYRDAVVNYLRGSFRSWPAYLEKWNNTEKVLMEAIDKAGRPRVMKHAQCEVCKRWFPIKVLEQDHIEPVGGVATLEELGRALLAMLCPTSNLQIICNYTLSDKRFNSDGPSCHFRKTYGEEAWLRRRDEIKSGKPLKRRKA